jgi:23S rRNA (guanosine2251-2'-O)-methyltransferase
MAGDRGRDRRGSRGGGHGGSRDGGPGLERVYGLHTVRAVLARRPAALQRLIVQVGRDDGRLAELIGAARDAGIAIETRPAAALDELVAGAVHQGAVAEVVPAVALDEDALLEALGSRPADAAPPLLLVLDGVQDPHNLGACLRTADAAGVDFIVAPRDRATGLTPAARKVAAGAAEAVAFVQVVNLARVLREIKEMGVWVVGTSDRAPKSLYEADLTGPLAVVMGAEGVGARRLTRELCDLEVALPMRGAVESLNVSVATGVVLYEAIRQRGLS